MELIATNIVIIGIAIAKPSLKTETSKGIPMNIANKINRRAKHQVLKSLPN